LADKYDKARLARLTKLLEIVIMGVALSGFMMHSLEVLLLALFLLGLQSTLFGPVKYAILPQHLHENELVGGNALVESGTFVAILMGTLAGGLLAGAAGHPTWVAFAGLAGRGCRLSVQPRHPAGCGAGSGSGRRPQSVCRDLAQHRLRARKPHGLPVDSRHLLVLAVRCAVPGAVPGVLEERSRR
jgi:MFS family permease